MKKYYLVDLENVKNSGLEGIEQLSSQDQVIVFYSDKADTLKIDVIQKISEGKADVTFIKADNGTPNSLDFQLITYLYYNLAKEDTESQFWIISKDTGYEASIRMAKKLGLNNVHRAPAIINAVHYHQRADKNNAVKPVEKERQEESYAFTDADAPEEPAEEPKDEDYDILNSQAASIDEKSSAEIYDYHAMHDLLNEKCSVDMDTSKLELIRKALANSENKNQFYQYFRRHMGDKEGSEFYKSIRSQYAALKEIARA